MVIDRGTKCFSGFHGSECNGAFPKNFLKWVEKQGWIGKERCYLCSGNIVDNEAIRVDIRQETNPTHCEDATKTSLKTESFDWVMIDPPYSQELAQKLYKTGEYFKSINEFIKEASRITKKDGLILTLSYEVPKTNKELELKAVWGIYTIPHTSFMRCFTVWKKRGEKE